LLLLVNDVKTDAARWLRLAASLIAQPTYWIARSKTFSHEPGAGSWLMKPSEGR
jgi:hypothetical protein